MRKRRSHTTRRKIIKRNRKPLLKNPCFWFSLFFIALFFGLSYLLIFSPYFQIKETSVSGIQTISKAELLKSFKDDSSITLDILGTSLISESLFLPKQGDITSLLENFPAIENISIKKDFFTQKITLEVKEKTPVAIWCSSEKCFLVDKKATYIKDFEDEVGFITINERDEYEKNLKVWSGETKQEFIVTLLTIYENNNEIKKFNVYSDRFTGVYNNVEFVFDPKEDIDWQIEKMAIVLKKLDNNIEGLTYIDLRFGEQVVIK
ncbi:MAG: hypothetical protein PHX52_01695 [Candidatus Pacebacteria bacterium]|nr:hypothetical protein [Candidatus Paceibacterota bacterium]MDD3919279.1 hypothetical protein [Candidatus Paceibacterota bacterium]